MLAASFTGALQSSPLDTSNINSGWGGNPTISLTTGTANDLVTATLSRFGTTDATSNRSPIFSSQIVFQGVQKIINDYDPVGLVEGGAPEDEYHDEKISTGK